MLKPSIKPQGELGFSLLLVVFSVTAFWQSYAISGFSGLASAGVFPMLASATMFIASVSILLRSLRQSQTSHSNTLDTQRFFNAVLPLRLVIVVLLITGYVIAMPTIGFLLASAIFLFLSFSYLWRKSFVVSLVITLVSVFSVYLIFRKLFQVVLPQGTLLQLWF